MCYIYFERTSFVTQQTIHRQEARALTFKSWFSARTVALLCARASSAAATFSMWRASTARDPFYEHTKLQSDNKFSTDAHETKQNYSKSCDMFLLFCLSRRLAGANRLRGRRKRQTFWHWTRGVALMCYDWGRQARTLRNSHEYIRKLRLRRHYDKIPSFIWGLAKWERRSPPFHPHTDTFLWFWVRFFYKITICPTKRPFFIVADLVVLTLR